MNSENNLNTSKVPERGDEDEAKVNSWRPRQQVQNRRGVPLKACRNCGKVWKYEHYCPAEESTCQLCGKIGHWAQVCRTSGQYDSTNKREKYNNDNKSNFRRRNGGGWKQNNRESNAPNNLNNNNNQFGNSRCNNGNENQDNATNNGHFKTQESHGRERATFNKNNNKRYQNNRNNFWKNSDKNNTDDDKCDKNEKNGQKTDGECADNSKKESTENDKDSDKRSEKFENFDKNNKNYNKPSNWRYRENKFDKNEPRRMPFRSKDDKKKKEEKTANKNEFKDEKGSDEEKKNDSKNPEENNSEENENSGFEESSTRRDTSYSFAGGDQPVFDKKTKYAYTSVGQSRYDPKAGANNNKNNENSTKNDGKNAKTTPEYSYEPENNYNSIGLKRKLANSFYQNGKYEAAMSHYSRLIELCPKDPVNFNNRCACYMALGQFKNAFTDAVTVVNLDSSCIKGYCRLIKCAILLGEITAAESNISRLLQLDPKNEIVAEERKKLRDLQENIKQQEIAANLKNYTKALECINKCLLISPHCLPYKIKKAEYSALLKCYNEAKELVDEILLKDFGNVDAKYIIGICLYYTDIDNAINYLKDLLRLDPDHAKILELYRKAKKISDAKKRANDAFLSLAFSHAHLLYSLALDIDKDHTQIKAKLYYNMGQASYNLGNFERAIKEYTEAINFDDTNFTALKRRGMSYMKMKEYEEAIADFTRVCKLNPQDDCQKLIEDAEKLLASVKKDFYEILGVSRDASVEEVKKAYKDKAMVHHPDRHSNATEEQKRKHERKFKDITLAYRDILERCKRKLGFTGNL